MRDCAWHVPVTTLGCYNRTEDLSVELVVANEREFVVTPFTNASAKIVYRLRDWQNVRRIRNRPRAIRVGRRPLLNSAKTIDRGQKPLLGRGRLTEITAATRSRDACVRARIEEEAAR